MDENKKRAKELVERMTIEEKISQLRFDAPAIPRLGVPAYNWWNEALHGVARAGTATVFPQAIGLASMFDDGFLREIASVIAEEGRAKYNAAVKEGDRDIYKGLTFWSPNINIFRDPRWGRGHETYGEDPFLTSRLGVAFVKGIQGNGKYLKAAACAKHFAVHSGPEDLRYEFDAQVTRKDLYETYLPAFEACVKEAKVESVMGAYNRVNGEPCCASPTLLCDILRDEWGFDGHVVSDCRALSCLHQYHKVTTCEPESAALGLKAGCDLNCGVTYLYLKIAYQRGLITEEEITRSAERAMTTRFRLGLFDKCEYDEIPYEVVDCREHNEMALEAARKSIVLLKNDGILPLDKTKIKAIAVIGPNADNRVALRGNYHGTPSRYITPLEGIQDEAGEETRIYYAKGCELDKDRTELMAKENDRLAEAVTAAKASDLVILCLGLDESIEGELPAEMRTFGGDKASMEFLPGQKLLLETIVETGKPVILLLMTGSCTDLVYADQHCSAIIQAWYPGARGGKAIADIIFGNCSPSAKLPVTFYRDVDKLPDYKDYSMEYRTYRYMKDPALYPFGYGLTYGNVICESAEILGTVREGEDFEVSCALYNKGERMTEDVVQAYIRPLDAPDAVRNYSLCGFRRVSMEAGERKRAVLVILAMALTVVDGYGSRLIEGRRFRLFAGMSQPDSRSRELLKKDVCIIDFEI